VDKERVAEIGLTVEQLQDLVDQDESVPGSGAVLWHGSVDDAGEAHELRTVLTTGRGVERLYEIRGHADAGAWQRDRRTW